MFRPVILVFAAALFMGCVFTTSKSQQDTSSSTLGWNKYDLGGGRYLIDIEVSRPHSSSINFRFQDQGQTKVEEFVEVSVGESTSLRIDMGKLQVNGSPRGEVKHGDRIKVHASGKVVVNNLDRQ